MNTFRSCDEKCTLFVSFFGFIAISILNFCFFNSCLPVFLLFYAFLFFSVHFSNFLYTFEFSFYSAFLIFCCFAYCSFVFIMFCSFNFFKNYCLFVFFWFSPFLVFDIFFSWFTDISLFLVYWILFGCHFLDCIIFLFIEIFS